MINNEEENYIPDSRTANEQKKSKCRELGKFDMTKVIRREIRNRRLEPGLISPCYTVCTLEGGVANMELGNNFGGLVG